MKPPIMISQTAEQRGFGSDTSYKRVVHLTPEERAYIRDGGLVAYDCGRFSGGGNGTGTRWRIALHNQYGYYPRVPSAEQLALIEKVTQ